MWVRFSGPIFVATHHLEQLHTRGTGRGVTRFVTDVTGEQFAGEEALPVLQRARRAG